MTHPPSGPSTPPPPPGPRDVEVFRFPATGHQFRVLSGDAPEWIATDICRFLGHTNPTMAVAGLDDDERGLRIVETPSGQQRMVVVNEAGLYSLILRSRKPEARAFRRWVTHEVLPAIRKTGHYEVAAVTPRQLAELVIAEANRADLAEARAAELEPDAARARRTLDADGLALVGTVAKRFGIKERALREFLYGEGLIIRGGNRHNEPYAQYIASGHFHLKTRLVGDDPDRPPIERSTTFITPKGEALIWKRLYAAGYVNTPQMPAQQLALT